MQLLQHFRQDCARILLLSSFALASGRSAAAEAPGHHVGVNTAYLPNLKQETIRRWVADSGAAMPRIGIRMDLARQGMPGHADDWVRECAARGGEPLAFLFNGHAEHTLPDGKKDAGVKPPEGLWEPVFDNGADEPVPGAKVNPKNEWAAFVAATVERYDGDGREDAKGSPKVTYFSIWNEPDWMAWPQRPKSAGEKSMRNWFGRDFRDLARLAFISHRAAKFANPQCKVGMQLCFEQSLGLLLDDPKHPLGKNCDFIDYHAYGGKTGDDNCFRNDGIVPVYRAMRAEYEKRRLTPPQFMCTETGVGGGSRGSPKGINQAGAVIKANVVGASLGLVTTCWYALVDPSWENMGLIADATKLAADGKSAEFRDAYEAMRTVALLLPPSCKFVKEIPAGADLHAYRFRDASGRDLVVAWVDDKKGPDATAKVKLPLKQGRWEVLGWQYASTKTSRTLEVEAADGAADVELHTTPVFLRPAE